MRNARRCMRQDMRQREVAVSESGSPPMARAEGARRIPKGPEVASRSAREIDRKGSAPLWVQVGA